MDDTQIEMLINSYGLEQILEDFDIPQETVLKLLLEERMLDGIYSHYFERCLPR